MDFWGIRLPHRIKSKMGKPISGGIRPYFLIGFWSQVSEVFDMNTDVGRGSFDLNDAVCRQQDFSTGLTRLCPIL